MGHEAHARIAYKGRGKKERDGKGAYVEQGKKLQREKSGKGGSELRCAGRTGKEGY